MKNIVSNTVIPLYGDSGDSDDTCDEHGVMYRVLQSLCCTPEVNVSTI